MDFNTGSGGQQRPNNEPPPPGAGPSQPRRSVGSGGGEFDLGDPVGSFVRTAREVVTNPVGFFRSIPREGSLVPPLAFALICAVIAGILSGVVGMLITLVSGNGFGSAIGTLFSGIFLTPIAAVIGLFIGSGIYHLLVILLAKPNHVGFSGTFRVVGYSSVVQLVSWLSVIPILGALIALAAGIYGIVLGVLGIREIHATSTGRAVAVVLIPTAILLLFVFLVVAVVIAAIFAGGQQQL